LLISNTLNLKEKIIKPVVTLGSFDGVHVAHKTIFKRVKDIADKIGGTSVILTFDPHPVEVLNPAAKISLISSKEEKIQLLEEAGIDVVIFIPFDLEFSKITSDDFVKKILVENIGIETIVVGYNHTFGHDRKGNFSLLCDMGKIYNFNVEEIPEQDIKNEAISSSKIRQALQEADIEKANKYLGYNYFLSVKVSEIDTKNLQNIIRFEVPFKKKLIPSDAEYNVKIIGDNSNFDAIISIKDSDVFLQTSDDLGFKIGEKLNLVFESVNI
jgi:riboflavin kinase/FMN adenylyltransferase